MHDHIIYAEASEYPFIGSAFLRVRLLQPFLIDIERIPVFHNKLPPADHTCAGAEFVTVFALYLVQGHRQVLVRCVHIFDHKGKHLFMRGGKKVVGLVPVLEAENIVAVFFPAVGHLIWFTRHHRGEMDFLGTYAVYLFPDNSLDPVQHTESQRQPGIQPRPDFAHVSCTYEEFRRINVSVGRVVAQSAQEQRRHM